MARGDPRSTAAHQARRLVVLRRDGWRCYWCGDHATETDHVIPLAEGGPDTLANQVAACTPCNAARGGQLAQRRRRLGKRSRAWIRGTNLRHSTTQRHRNFGGKVF